MFTKILFVLMHGIGGGLIFLVITAIMTRKEREENASGDKLMFIIGFVLGVVEALITNSDKIFG